MLIKKLYDTLNMKQLVPFRVKNLDGSYSPWYRVNYDGKVEIKGYGSESWESFDIEKSKSSIGDKLKDNTSLHKWLTSSGETVVPIITIGFGKFIKNSDNEIEELEYYMSTRWIVEGIEFAEKLLAEIVGIFQRKE